MAHVEAASGVHEGAGLPSAEKKCCATADEALSALMEDETLRPGDVISSPQGMQVYVGESAGNDASRKLVPIQLARHVAHSLRARLMAYAPVELPKTRTAKVRRAARETPVHVVTAQAADFVGPPMELRSAAQIKTQYIVDPAGKRVRFVGGYAPH